MRRSLFLAINSAIAAGVIGVATVPALADPSPAIVAALVATTNQPSYHLTITSPGAGSSESDVVKPEKVHTISKDGESIVIGPTMYMKIGGKWTKTNVPDFWTTTDAVKEMQNHHADYTSIDLGMITAAGVPYHAYRVTDTKKHNTQTVFIDAAGRLGRIEAHGLVMTYSKYGETVSIEPPM